jgi:hypothetical protein
MTAPCWDVSFCHIDPYILFNEIWLVVDFRFSSLHRLPEHEHFVTTLFVSDTISGNENEILSTCYR